nr:hypothetical protein SYMBAF_50303 [Serratia symbiotica]
MAQFDDTIHKPNAAEWGNPFILYTKLGFNLAIVGEICHLTEQTQNSIFVLHVICRVGHHCR